MQNGINPGIDITFPLAKKDLSIDNSNQRFSESFLPLLFAIDFETVIISQIIEVFTAPTFLSGTIVGEEIVQLATTVFLPDVTPAEVKRVLMTHA